MNCKNCIKQGCSLAGKDHEMSFDCKLYVNGSAYKYDNFKADPPRVDDGWYLVKDGMTYRVEVPINKMRFTKSINILTGEVYYPSNADRIRSMSDEELADEILSWFNWLNAVEWDDKRIIEWLKQEVSTDG